MLTMQCDVDVMFKRNIWSLCSHEKSPRGQVGGSGRQAEESCAWEYALNPQFVSRPGLGRKDYQLAKPALLETGKARSRWPCSHAVDRKWCRDESLF